MRWILLPLLGFVALAAPAGARPAYPDYLPAAPVDGRCGTCHTDPLGGSARNSFGLDVEASIDGAGPEWSALFCLDSDGDGKTNGQELGDPCGTWEPGERPLRSEPLSAPGNPDDAVDVQDGSVCDGSPPPECQGSAADAVGCAQGSSAALCPLLSLLVLPLLRWRVRTARRSITGRAAP